MHRADDQDTLDLIRALMSMHVTLILIGVDIPRSGLLREGRFDTRSGQIVFRPKRTEVLGLEATQTERRFDLVELDRFRYDTPAQISAWVEHLAGVEECPRLTKARPPDKVAHRQIRRLRAGTGRAAGRSRRRDV